MMTVKTTTIYLFLLQIVKALSDQSDSPYISRLIDGKVRHCIRIFDCPAGNEILPCTVDYTEDSCHKCTHGYVQPDYISSSETSKTCFKQQRDCRGQDLKASRTPNTKSCEFNKYCKCDTDNCYYGDPCHCRKKPIPCRIDETMNNTGICVACPPGTEKTETGCGHCKRITLRQEVKTSEERNETTSNIVTKVYQGIEQNNQRKQTSIVEQAQEDTKQGSQTEDKSSHTALLTGLLVLSAVLVIGVILVVSFLLYRRRRTSTEGTTNDDVEGGQLLPGPVENDDIEGGQLVPGKVENDVNREQDENENIQQNSKHERYLINMPPPSSVYNNGVRDTSASGSFDSAKTNTILTTETSVGSKYVDTTIEESTSLNLTKHFEQSTSSLTLEISKIINEGTVVPSCEPDECLSSVSVLKDEQNFSQDVPSSYKEIHEQRLSTDNNVVHVTSSKLNDLDRTYSNTPNNISSHIQITDVHSNPVTQETHLDNMPSNTDLKSSGLERSVSDNDISLKSPMSEHAFEEKPQDYENLVSGSVSNTDTMVSGLEYHNFDLTKTPSVCNQSTECKEETADQDSGVYESN